MLDTASGRGLETLSCSLYPTAPAGNTPGAAITKRYQDAMTPGEPHAWLAKLEGKWKTSARLLTEPDGPAVEMTGTSEFKMLMDGRFLVESHDAGGSAGPFRGMGMLGFNNITGKYERVWFDSNSTAMLRSEGEYVAEGNSIRWTDQRSDPRTGRVRDLPLLQACHACHDGTGVRSFNTYLRDTSRRLEPPVLIETAPAAREAASIFWKTVRHDWGRFRGLTEASGRDSTD